MTGKKKLHDVIDVHCKFGAAPGLVKVRRSAQEGITLKTFIHNIHTISISKAENRDMDTYIKHI